MTTGIIPLEKFKLKKNSLLFSYNYLSKPFKATNSKKPGRNTNSKLTECYALRDLEGTCGEGGSQFQPFCNFSLKKV